MTPTTPESPRPPEDLLSRIEADLRPVRPQGATIRRVLLWAPLGVVFFIGIPLAFGLRRDATALGPIVTWGASAAQIAFGAWLVWAGAREFTPGRRLPIWRSTTALGAAAAIVLLLTMVTLWMSPTILPASISYWHGGTFCFRGSLVVGAPPLFLAAILLGRALPGAPWLAGALFGAGAGLTADATWRLVCPVSDPVHVLMAHGGAVLTLAVVGAATAAFTARRSSSRSTPRAARR